MMAGLTMPIDKCGHMTMTVNVTGIRRFRMRLAVVRFMVWMASIAAPANLSIDLTVGE